MNMVENFYFDLPLVVENRSISYTVYPKKYAQGFVVLCFVVVIQSFIMNSHEVFIHIHQGYFAGTGAIVRFPQCQWSKPDGYGKISQCITTTKHSKAKTVCIFLGIYCNAPLATTKMLILIFTYRIICRILLTLIPATAYFGLFGQYYACWCPGYLSCQGTRRNYIDNIG